jgi:hypothetical protein
MHVLIHGSQVLMNVVFRRQDNVKKNWFVVKTGYVNGKEILAACKPSCTSQN